MYCSVFLCFHLVCLFYFFSSQKICDIIIHCANEGAAVLYSFFSLSWMLKFIHQNPVMARSHCFLRVLTVSCPLHPGDLDSRSSQLWLHLCLGGALGMFSTSDSHKFSRPLRCLVASRVSAPWFGPCAVWCSDLLPKMYFNSIVMEICALYNSYDI